MTWTYPVIHRDINVRERDGNVQEHDRIVAIGPRIQ